ncbi:hypothetical protein ACTWQL_23965 [Pseudalkalibacillus sp. R45]|uniref:hypothetical protein n=1 Tax=Pseudalkalibacillus sp. R45 TaxID=3457433 RepID=UPI003FCD95F7
MKKFIASILVVWLISLMGNPLNTYANENVNVGKDSKVIKNININNETVIKKLSDGRIAPVDDVSKLNSSSLQQILNTMGFDDEEIAKMNTTTKEEIISSGGKKVKLEMKLKKRYRSLDGKVYEYTGFNDDLINKVKQSDIEKYNKTNNTTYKINDLENPPSLTNFSTSSVSYGTLPYTDDQWWDNGTVSGGLWVTYLGPSINGDLTYQYSGNIWWAEPPSLKLVDGMGMAWDERAIPESGTYAGQRYGDFRRVIGPEEFEYYTETYDVNDMDVDVYGVGYKFRLLSGAFQQGANLSRNVLVSPQDMGRTAYVQYKYFHTHATLTGLGISMGPVSINFNGAIGDEFIAEYNYTYGQT